MNTQAANDDDDLGGEARQWIVRLASGAMPSADIERLNLWLDLDPEHRRAFQRERRTWQDLAMLEGAFASDEATVTPYRARRRLPLIGAISAIAACIAAMWLAPTMVLFMKADYSTSTHAASIDLPDGSRAVLDAGTALAVDFDGTTRSIELLKGRAWFDVMHGDARPFRVTAAGGVTQDIGTAFAVEKGRNDEVTVGVTQGAVRVSGHTGNSVLLRAGAQARYSSTLRVTSMAATDPTMIAEWRQGEILVRAMPIAAAVEEIARYRSAPVFVWGDLSSMAPVSGSFRADRPDDAIQTLIVMRGLQQMRLPGGVMILRKPAEK